MDKNFFLQLVQKLSKYFLFGVVACYAAAVSATPIPNNESNPKTFLGPTAALSVTKGISDNTAFSVLGEAGLRNFRLGGTIGWELSYYQRLKASAELLRQKITYSFFDGRESPWMDQGALGLDYQYDFHETLRYSTQLDLAGYVSHAPTKNLGTSSGTYINNVGVPVNYLVNKRVAGSNGFGLSPGVTFSPWYGTSAGLRLNYDNVQYDTAYGIAQEAKGFGGTARIDQMIVEDVNLGLTAEVRQPFNYYEADIAWGNLSYHGLWTLKLFGAYTIGKSNLPTTYNVGIGADYFIDSDKRFSAVAAPPLPEFKDQQTRLNERKQLEAERARSHDFKGEGTFKDRVYKDMVIPPVEWDDSDRNTDLLKWTSMPAVYLPQVLAISNQRTILDASCTAPPVLLALIPDVFVPGGDFPYTFNAAPFFSGSNLTFTATAAPTIAGQIPSVSVSGSTITYSNLNLLADFPIIGTVTATNACGSVTTPSFTMTN